MTQKDITIEQIKERIEYIQKHGAVRARAVLMKLEKELERRKKVQEAIEFASGEKKSPQPQATPVTNQPVATNQQMMAGQTAPAPQTTAPVQQQPMAPVQPQPAPTAPVQTTGQTGDCYEISNEDFDMVIKW